MEKILPADQEARMLAALGLSPDAIARHLRALIAKGFEPAAAVRRLIELTLLMFPMAVRH